MFEERDVLAFLKVIPKDDNTCSNLCGYKACQSMGIFLCTLFKEILVDGKRSPQCKKAEEAAGWIKDGPKVR